MKNKCSTDTNNAAREVYEYICIISNIKTMQACKCSSTFTSLHQMNTICTCHVSNHSKMFVNPHGAIEKN